MTTQPPTLNPTLAASATPGHATPVKRLSLKKNFSWAFAGNAVYQACQWGMLVVLAKLTSAEEVGRFALALAICTPITVFLSLNLRAVQVTDAEDENTFGQFLALRILTVIAALAIIAAVAVFSGYPFHIAGVIFVVGLSQSVMMTREVFQSFMQKHERMDKVAVSQALAGVLSLGSLGLTVYLTQDLLAGVIAMFLARLASFGAWDLTTVRYLISRLHLTGPAAAMRPQFRMGILGKLAWLALPLGVTSVLLSLYTNLPKYLIAAMLDEEALGFFSAIMALTLAGTITTSSAAHSALPRLSNLYPTQRSKFLRLLCKLMALGAGLGILGLIIVLLWGQVILTVLFTPEYATHNELFVWSMGFGAIAYTVTFLGFGMSAMRRFHIQPVANLCALIVAALVGWFTIPIHGIVGGVWCLIAGKLTQGLVAGIVIWTGIRWPSLPEKTATTIGPPVQALRKEAS